MAMEMGVNMEQGFGYPNGDMLRGFVDLFTLPMDVTSDETRANSGTDIEPATPPRFYFTKIRSDTRFGSGVLEPLLFVQPNYEYNKHDYTML
jgi:hypothetical protein